MARTPRGRGERGIAMVMTGLILLPLMVFAAFGVDLASWYARISYLQKSADAAALAGTVWMPDLGKATAEAKASLRENGIVDKDEGGIDDIDVVVGRGSRATSLRVVVTDNSATRYFSQVFSGNQTLSRSAEAEYNLPIPLGSPLNYFGGDRTKSGQPPFTTYSVGWPSDYTTRVPVNSPCNIGTSSGQGLGRWAGSPPTYRSGEFDGGDPQCRWGSSGVQVAGVSSVPPPDYTTRPPNNASCRIRVDGVGSGTTLGFWRTGPLRFTVNWGGGGAPSRLCSWNNFATDTSTILPDATTRPPTNQPCRVGYEDSGPGGGWWNGGYAPTTPAAVVGGSQANGNRLCQWGPQVDATTVTPPNPIAADRSPGFWAAISGPGGVAVQGNAYSVRCTQQLDNCSPANRNTMYRDTGYWYVVKMPASGASTTEIRVFDASYDMNGSGDVRAGDSRDGGTGPFDVEYRVYRQTNPLDFDAREPTPGQPGSPNASDNSCWWKLPPSSSNTAAFGLSWRTLCTVTPADGAIYLVNVKTSSADDTGAGLNGYAVEAVSSGPNQPEVYAFGDMAMFNNIEDGAATFYLAEIGPQYAGKTLVIELWDSGDADGVARMTPMQPDGPTGLAGPVVPVPSARCTYGADTPNPRHDSSQYGGATTPAVANGTQPPGLDCTITTANQTSPSGTPRRSIFNDQWLTIRVDIPQTYTCDVTRNPVIEGGSCWWGIHYDFNRGATDATTWRARIEGNPVHLIQ